MKIYFLFLLICISLNLTAQNNYLKGYIVTNENDTIHGYINLRTDGVNQQLCTFSTLKDGQDSKTYSPQNIVSYRFSSSPNKYYVRKKITTENTDKGANPLPQNEFIFVEYLVSGIIDLFYFIDTKTGLEYFILEENGQAPLYLTQHPPTIENNKSYSGLKYKGILRYRFQDYPEIIKTINSGNFDQKTMIKITKMYDDLNCTPTSEKCIIFENDSPDQFGLKIKISAYIGLQHVAFSFMDKSSKAMETKDTGKKLSPMLGVQVHFSNPRFSESWGGLFDASFAKIDNKTKKGIKGSIGSKDYIYDYKGYLMNIKIGPRYTFQKSKLKPSLDAGAIFSMLFNASCKRTIILYDIEEQFYMQKNNFGLFAGAGLEYQIFNNQSIFCRFNYDFYLSGNLSHTNQENKIESWQLKLGYTF